MDETTLDLKEIIRTIKKQYLTILVIFAAFVILAVIISFLTPPTYQAETTLRIKQPKGLADSLLGDLPVGGPANTKQLMSTYAEIMKSRTVVQQVIDQTQQSKEKIPTYEDMLERISTQPVKDTEILKVKVTAG
ncbi:MAG: Wzz/FepE/Etk N-terminal domain-containing protein, partial [Bacillota bacterium]